MGLCTRPTPRGAVVSGLGGSCMQRACGGDVQAAGVVQYRLGVRNGWLAASAIVQLFGGRVNQPPLGAAAPEYRKHVVGICEARRASPRTPLPRLVGGDFHSARVVQAAGGECHLVGGRKGDRWRGREPELSWLVLRSAQTLRASPAGLHFSGNGLYGGGLHACGSGKHPVLRTHCSGELAPLAHVPAAVPMYFVPRARPLHAEAARGQQQLAEPRDLGQARLVSLGRDAAP
mmetsp:Transcript_119972/g.344859  ORF Transcript_119972/g.344859 Transcript_119972/m.344859 type:complete len:232 (-) Transcript_119972:1010-1705(-)